MKMLLAALEERERHPTSGITAIRVRVWAQFVRHRVFKVAYHFHLEEKKNASR